MFAPSRFYFPNFQIIAVATPQIQFVACERSCVNYLFNFDKSIIGTIQMGLNSFDDGYNVIFKRFL